MTKPETHRLTECVVGVAALTAGCWLVAPHLGLIVFGSLCLAPTFVSIAQSFRKGPS